MISLNWSDVISVLNMCKAYLIAIAAVILIGIVVIAACRKKGSNQKINQRQCRNRNDRGSDRHCESGMYRTAVYIAESGSAENTDHQ